MICQIPPSYAKGLTLGTWVRPYDGASGLVRDQNQRVELRGFEPLTPSMRTRCATGLRYSPKNASQRSKSWDLFAHPDRRAAPQSGSDHA
jgi:hypothetical protein